MDIRGLGGYDMHMLLDKISLTLSRPYTNTYSSRHASHEMSGSTDYVYAGVFSAALNSCRSIKGMSEEC